MVDLILGYNSDLKRNLDRINVGVRDHSFRFKTHQLLPYSGKGTKKNCPVWQELGWRFKLIEGPIVYWFHIQNDILPIEILEAARACKHNQIEGTKAFRRLPSITNGEAQVSSILYVGACEKTSLMNRMFWHLGYYSTGRTQGLQLCHWSRELNLDLVVNVMSFPPEASSLIKVYEKLVAQQLKPIIGR